MPSDAETLTPRADYKKKRGELRIYLGAAPGVGKTYAMLDEGHRRLERGTDVVVALVETHGRKKTAEEMAGIEIIPRKSSSIAAAGFPNSTSRPCSRAATGRARRRAGPHQHPGSKNPKRWQDVEELLDAGIT